MSSAETKRSPLVLLVPFGVCLWIAKAPSCCAEPAIRDEESRRWFPQYRPLREA